MIHNRFHSWTLALLIFMAGVQPIVATDDTPVDQTSLIQNPSFEQNGTEGWTVSNMNTQSNSVFSRKKGTYYLESWVSIGQAIGNASVTQTLKDLPRGNYRLQASALHIQQSSSGSTVNKGTAQTGAWIIAGTARTEVTAMKQYTVSFAALDEKNNIEIGLLAENATGNYLCVDNFTLQYMGEVTLTAFAEELQRLVSQGQELLDKGIQTTVAETLSAAITAANTALQGTGIDGEGQTVYDETALTEARQQLLTAIEAAKASRERYDNLQQRIDYGQTVIGWWKDV